ncbi:MAG: SusC/RagA family TonB-linked outer membrane protein [Bacteroidales bacterium]|nr:SusC/RagA family TonB-linked outer membrane protein [Prevotella sp.]MBR3411123.1 SusC/RagA family TonB-linked outer membrane protein [Bacteroidales bacterium]
MMSNRLYRILGLIILSCQLSIINAFAQQAGDVISGTVVDDFGPVVMANVVEIDAANRIVASTVTDINGNFSFRVKNVKDKLRISFVGYKTQTFRFDRTHYEVTMVDATQISEVTVTARRRTDGAGLQIPLDEISTARQSIDMKEFDGLAITTVDEALQGRIAGLDIVANSGNLGSGTSMRLRGVSSINGSSEPLIVVDGNVWETNTNNFDFQSANEEKFAELLNVNPEDIESISVLKDAAATAVWGSQGSNGVIEIKTKRGTRGQTRVNYSYRLTGTYQPNGYEMLNGDEYTMLLKEEYFNPSLSDASSDIPELNYNPSFSEYEMYNNNTDWLKEVKKVGWRQNHYLALTGGGEKAHFRIGAGYDHETGSIIEQVLNRFTSRVNLDYFVSDRIKIETNIALTYTKNKKNNGDLLSIAYVRMPNLSVYEQDRNGNDLEDYYSMLPTVSSQLRDQLDHKNPVALAHLASNDETSYNITPEFKLRYNLLGLEEDKTRLAYEGKVVFNIFNRYEDQFMPLSLSTRGWNDTNNRESNRTTASSSKSLGVTTTHTLTFTPAFKNKDHVLTMMLRGQLTSGTSSDQRTVSWGLPSGSITSPAAEGIIQDISTGSGQWRSIYFTYSAHYAYKARYMADFTVRRDGCTKFGDNQRWGNFPAFSLRWNISKEPWFIKALPFVSMLSIRPGWGISGRQPGSEGLFFSKYRNGSGYLGEGSIYPQNIQLRNLKWEQKETYNLGTDFGFFNERITGNVELYWQYTTDLLMASRGIPTSSGYSTLAYQNVGDMKNIGWEFNLNGNRIIRYKKFSFDVNVTFANNKNQITRMDETCLASLNHEFDRNNGSYLSRVELNRAMGSIYGFRYKGVYQYSDYTPTEIPGVSGPDAPVVRDENDVVILDENQMTKPMTFCYGSVNYEFRGGDAKYDDVNHDGQINELDIVYLGSSLPKFTGGFGFKLNFGRLTWNNQFNFRYGNKIINAARMRAENMYSNNNQSRAVNWRWRVEGDVTDIPRALRQTGYNWLGSDRFVENGSFIRLNYSQLSYSFDPRVIKKIGLTQLSFYLSANNLFCLTKYSGADPEVGYGSMGVVTDGAKTPRAKSFTAGITVVF